MNKTDPRGNDTFFYVERKWNPFFYVERKWFLTIYNKFGIKNLNFSGVVGIYEVV